MSNKNPYENTDTVDIPDFVEDKSSTRSSSVDMSIFKMNDEEEYADDEEYVEEYEESPKRKLNSTVLICIILIVLLLATSIAAILFALKEKNALADLDVKYQQVVAKEEAYNSTIANLNSQVDELTKKLEEKKAEENAAVYEIVDGPVTFRVGPNKNESETTYDGESYAWNGEEFKVKEIVNDSKDAGYKWAKLSDKVYFCIGTDDDVWAEKQ